LRPLRNRNERQQERAFRHGRESRCAGWLAGKRRGLPSSSAAAAACRYSARALRQLLRAMKETAPPSGKHCSVLLFDEAWSCAGAGPVHRASARAIVDGVRSSSKGLIRSASPILAAAPAKHWPQCLVGIALVKSFGDIRGISTAKQRSLSAHSWRTARRSSCCCSLLYPAYPIQSPPPFRSKRFIALAKPPELCSVLQPSSAFRNVRGRRFETTMRRAPPLGSADNLVTGCKPTFFFSFEPGFQSPPIRAVPRCRFLARCC